MYVIFSDGDPVYSPNLVEEGYVITSGKLTTELNKAGSLEFTIPMSNPMYSKIKMLKSIITLEEDGEEIWRGRVIEETRDFYNNKKFLCEGELGFLNDILYEPYDFSDGVTISAYFLTLIGLYELQCSPERLIKPGNVYVTDPLEQVFIKSDEYTDILTDLNNLLTDAGGYVIFRKEDGVSYLDYYEKLEEVIDQTITFGNNLIDLEEYLNGEDLFTYLFPLGKKKSKGNRVDISSVEPGGFKYIYSEKGEEMYGKIWRTVVFDDISSPSALMKQGKKLLDLAIESATSITINAIDLHQLGVDASRIKIGVRVPVISIPHGLDSNLLCSKAVLDLSDPSSNEYNLGLEFTSLTNEVAANKKKADSAYLRSGTILVEND